MASYTTSGIFMHGAVIFISRIDGYWESDLDQVGFLVQQMCNSLHHRSAPAFLIHGMKKLEVHIQRGVVIGRVVEVKTTNSNRRFPAHNSYSMLLRSLQVDLKVQQELLRHSDIRTTMNIYTRAVPDAKREANSRVLEMLPPRRKVG